MAINVSVQYNGGFLPDFVLLILCDYIDELQFLLLYYCIWSVASVS